MDQKIVNAYKILGLRLGASQEEISAAYKKRATEYHPDKASHLGEELIEFATKKMKEINCARDILEKFFPGDQEFTEDNDQEEVRQSGSGTYQEDNSFTNDLSRLDLIAERKIESPDELNRLREWIQKWLNAIPGRDPASLGSRIGVLSGYYRPAYRVVLESQSESRILRQVKKPASGHSIRFPDLLKSCRVNVWTLDLPLVNRFAGVKADHPNQSSAMVWGCGMCNGNKIIPCPMCEGSGRNKYDACYFCENGVAKCPECDGQGFIITYLSVHHKYAVRRDPRNIYHPKLKVDFIEKLPKVLWQRSSDLIVKLFESIRSEWTADDVTALRHDGIQAAAVSIANEARSKKTKMTARRGSRIVQQRLSIFQMDIWCVEHRLFDKIHELYIYGKDGAVWTDENPIYGINEQTACTAGTGSSSAAPTQTHAEKNPLKNWFKKLGF